MSETLRPFEPRDVDFAVEQCIREGWTVSPSWFRLYLEHDPAGCLVAEAEGRVAGMVTTACYAESGWVGNLIVSPEHRRGGLGTRLMRAALELLERRGISTVRLEADPPGMGIYRRLGFVSEVESLRFQRRGPQPRVVPEAAETLGEESLPEVAAFDRPRFGDDRGRMLALLLADAEAAFQLRREGALAGYAMLRATASGLVIGPWVAVDRTAAAALLGAALARCGDADVTLGLPAACSNGQQLLAEHSFTATPSSFRMVRGEVAVRGEPASVYAIASGAIG